jgi:hypothetical protein
MIPHPVIDRLVYLLIIILSLVALVLVLISPSGILNSRVIYQGF